jgi:acetyl esterase/lipase
MRSIQFIFIFLLSINLHSQVEVPEIIWDNVMIHRDIIYGQDDPASQLLDIYTQSHYVGEPEWYIQDTLKRKTLVHFHGGGWLLGDKTSIVGINSDLVFYPFLTKGFNVVNVNYREGNNTAPAAVEDALYALGWIADNADPYNIDIDKIILMGESAGGHLALAAGILFKKKTYKKSFLTSKIHVCAIINIAGITDIAATLSFMQDESNYDWNYPLLWIGDTSRISSISEKYSPIHLVDKDCPPIITGHGKLDDLVPYQHAEKLHKMLDQYGIKNKLISFEKGKHMAFGDAGTRHFYQEVFLFLDELGL